MISSALNPFLNFSNISAEFIFSTYDDALNFDGQNDSDIIVLWLDISRYNSDNFIDFFENQVGKIRAVSNKPILIGYNAYRNKFK